MFMCEMFGCFDSATHDIEFTNAEEFQVCETCLEFLRREPSVEIKFVKEFANRKGN